MNTCGSGWIASSANERRVIEPGVPVLEQPARVQDERVLVVGSSLAGSHSAGTRCASPSSVPKRSSKSTTVPSLCRGSGFGYSLPVEPEVVVAQAAVVGHERDTSSSKISRGCA